MDTLSKILLLMKEKGIEQKDFAADLGLHKNIVSDWKGGRNHSYNKYIGAISEYFGVSTDYLLNDDALPQVTKKEPLQDIEAVFKLYNALIDYGFIKPGEELTDEKVDLLLDFLSVNRRFLEHKLKNDD